MTHPTPTCRRRAGLAFALAGLLTGVLLISVSGCAVLGRRQTDQPIDPEKVAEVTAGMSKIQVTNLLGAPQEIIFSNKEHDPLREHAYVYEYKAEAGTAIFFGVINFGRLDAKRDRVVVFFDEAGLVANVAATLRGLDTKFGFPFGG